MMLLDGDGMDGVGTSLDIDRGEVRTLPRPTHLIIMNARNTLERF